MFLVGILTALQGYDMEISGMCRSSAAKDRAIHPDTIQ